MIDTTVTIEDEEWTRALPEAEALCRTAVEAALGYVGAPGACELAVVLADDATVQELNARWRDKDRPTNVLSFPADDDEAEAEAQDRPVLLGDVIVAYGVVAGESVDLGLGLKDRLCHMVVHGVLHLMGYDHQNEAEAIEMEGAETAILAGLGIADPYAGPIEDRSDQER